MNETQQVQDHVETVREPEELVRLLANQRVSEHEDNHHDHKQHHTRDT